MRAPASGCSRTSAHSSSSSGSALSRIAAGSASLPTSCTSAPSWIAAAESASAPSWSATSRAYSATVAECSAVSASKAASARTSATPVASDALSTALAALRLRQGVRRNRLTRVLTRRRGRCSGAKGSRASPHPSTTLCGQPLRNGRRPVQAPAVVFVQLTAPTAVTSRGPSHGPNRGPNHGPIRVRPYDAPSGSRDCIRGSPGRRFLGPSTCRLYRIPTRLASSPNLSRTTHSRSVMAPRAPMRYGPQIPEKRRAGEARSGSRMDPRVPPCRPWAPDTRVPQVSRASGRNRRIRPPRRGPSRGSPCRRAPRTPQARRRLPPRRLPETQKGRPAGGPS